MDQIEQAEKLARDVLVFSRNTLLVNLRFLDSALSRLKPVANLEITFGTDGKILAFTPKSLLQLYVKDCKLTVRAYLHTVLHCVFRHPFVSEIIDRRLWNLACDIAIEACINSLELSSAESPAQNEQNRYCNQLAAFTKHQKKKKIYHYYQNNPLNEAEYSRLERLFFEDDHRLWYMSNDEKNAAGIGNPNNSGDNQNDEKEQHSNQNSASQTNTTEIGSEADWKQIAERIQTEMETFSKQKGDSAGAMMQNLRAVNREKYDYSSFLKKFAVMGEAMRINDDEFDYVFYTYGLQLYKNMPLIEPLEYKEIKQVREFVIAIDTSGSVSGELVQVFLQKTFNIMKQSENFFRRINVHIIQCDAQIQEHIKITSQKEFDAYIKTMQIRGIGGTDFRPVFRFVDELIAQKEFYNLKGMIYFTDGYGDFPAKKPNYETAFVFIDEEDNNPIVPPWAIKLILKKDEIT